jgi:hypothetical protein
MTSVLLSDSSLLIDVVMMEMVNVINPYLFLIDYWSQIVLPI